MLTKAEDLRQTASIPPGILQARCCSAFVRTFDLQLAHHTKGMPACRKHIFAALPGTGGAKF